MLIGGCYDFALWELRALKWGKRQQTKCLLWESGYYIWKFGSSGGARSAQLQWVRECTKQSHTLANMFLFFWWEHKKCTQYIVVVMALQWVLIYAHIYGKYFYIFFVKDAKKVTAAGRYLCVWIYMYAQVYAYVALIATSECLYEMISLYERH